MLSTHCLQSRSADPEKLLKVQTWPVPQSTREVQQFLGLANYYHRFIHNFARIAKPLHKLTECTATFPWSQESQQSFETLRDRLSSPLILSYPDFTNPFILDTDASNDGIGAVLSQCDEQGDEHVIALCYSRLLSKAERNYCVTRKELLAVITFISYFRPYLLGQHFTLRIDHGALTWLLQFKDLQGQLAHWLEKIQEYNFPIVHRKGQ